MQPHALREATAPPPAKIPARRTIETILRVTAARCRPKEFSAWSPGSAIGVLGESVHIAFSDPLDLDDLRTRALPGENLNRTARHSEDLGQKNHEAFVRRAVDRRRGQTDLERFAVNARDRVCRRARLHPNGKPNSAVRLAHVQL